MCKHAAAVLYGVGARLDRSPELLFTLRKVDQQDLIAKAGSDLTNGRTRPAGAKKLANEDLCEMFGIIQWGMSMVRHLEAPDREVILQRLARALAGREEIVFAYAHGSFLLPHGFRDIDVAVWTGPHASARADVELARELSQVSGLPVDVRVVNPAPVSYLFHVFRGRLLTVRDERLLADLIERTARSYHDLAPLSRQATREAFTP
jgi:hypothetical protein